MKRLLIAVVLLAGCSHPPVHGVVTHKRQTAAWSVVEWRMHGEHQFPIKVDYPAGYEIGVSGMSVGGRPSVAWFRVDEDEYDDTRLGDKWQDGWHVAKTHK